MANNIKNRLGCKVNIFLMIVLIFVCIPTGQALTSAGRTIDNGGLTAGNSTNVTVVIQNGNTPTSLSLQETTPPGWNLTPMSGNADTFKASTNEWIWFTVAANDVKTITYKLTVPSDAATGMYNINGNITANGTIESVTGDNTIEVTGVSVADTVAPTTILSGVNEGGIYTDSVVITLTAEDNKGGSGVKNTTFSLNGATMAIYSGPLTVTNVGQNNIVYMSTDNAGNVENIKNVNFTINSGNPIGQFGFVAMPLSATVDIGEIATYNLTLTNTGSVADTYDLVANGQNNATVNLAQNNVTVEQGNSAVVELTVTSQTVGTYVVNVSAMSEADKNNNATVTTTTSVIVPVLTIGNFVSVPNSAISSVDSAKISADVTKGIFDISKVEFGIVDSNNFLGKGEDTVLITRENTSGAEGSYNPEAWPAIYATLGNLATTDVVSINIGDGSEFATVRGIFKADNASNGTDAVMSFNMTTGDMSNITNFDTGELLAVQSATSTFQARTTKFNVTLGNVTPGDVSSNAFTLYDMSGNVAVNNPNITVKTVPNGNYEAYALATDTNGSVYKLIDINTVPTSTGSGGGSSGGSSSSGTGTYPTITQTPQQNVTTEPTTTPIATEIPVPTVTVEPTTVSPVETTTEVPVAPTATKGAPGIGIVVTIGIIGAIYLIRRRK